MTRYFILAPEDFLYKETGWIDYWVLCKTVAKDNFVDIYMRDDYEEIKQFKAPKDAINYAKKRYKLKRAPTTI